MKKTMQVGAKTEISKPPDVKLVNNNEQGK